MEPSEATHRWVAGPDAARDSAHALFSESLRRPRLWVALLVMVVSLTVLLLASGLSVGPAVVIGTGGIAAGAGLLYVRVRRRFARQVPPGLALESEFGPDFVVLRGPSTESKVSFSGIDQVRRRGDWALLRQRPSRVTSCWPIELFPADELTRLQHAVSRQN